MMLLSFCPSAGCDVAAPTIAATTILSDTSDVVGPYAVYTVVEGIGDHRVELRYRLDDTVTFIPVLMESIDEDEDSGDGELYRAAIPGARAGTRISYYIAVLDGTGSGEGGRLAADPEAGAAAPYQFTILPTMAQDSQRGNAVDRE